MTKDGEFVLIGVGSQATRQSTRPSPVPPTAEAARRLHQQPRQHVAAAGWYRRRRHDGRSQQEHGHVDPLVTAARRDTTSGVHVQHRAASRRRDADGQLAPTAAAAARQRNRARRSPAAVATRVGGRRARRTRSGAVRAPAGERCRARSRRAGTAPRRQSRRHVLAARPRLSSVAAVFTRSPRYQSAYVDPSSAVPCAPLLTS